jgi:hypothetical protein
MKFFTEQ